MIKAKDGDTVRVQYTGKLKDGSVFDSSMENDSLQFTIGKGQVLHGVEQAVIGMQPQESKTVLVPAAEAYGPHRDEMTTQVQRSQFPDSVVLKVGQRLKINQKNGQSVAVSVLGLSASTVTLDANHPLAGKDLTFDLQLVEIA
ncbi:MAG: peptidylprolyl isomerase [Desulfurellaceae bacterium]|nr:peptidylprolyl isomerase [Desulfurellaceae bacterium]